jgi:hypothetical protein
MAQAPQIDFRDGVGTTQYLDYTTNQTFTSITGTIPLDTVDVQVNLNGGGWVSDPTLILLDSTVFQVPNPTAMPDGIPLDLGVNTVELRSIDILGRVSAPSVVTVTRVDQLVQYDYLIPTGIRLHRRRDSVDLLVATTDLQATLLGGTELPLEFRGFNFYASSSAGGTSGYYKVNDKPVSAVTESEEDLFEVDRRQTDFAVASSMVRIRVDQEDGFGGTVANNLDVSIPLVRYDGNFRFASTLNWVQLQDFCRFRHDRHSYGNIVEGNQANVDQWVGIPTTQELYYVVAGVYYDPNQNVEFETPYSQEVVGAPVVLDTNLKDLPGRVASQISLDFITAIQRVDSEISLLPGSSTRDISIDPFASEAERVWFLVDFVHRSQSFLTLLQIDDANQDQVSDPVATSSYKQALKAALGFTSDIAVQQLIDTQFEKLAKNLGKTRLPGRPAIGQAVLWTKTRPTRDIPIPSGTTVSTDSSDGSSVQFLIGGTYILPAAQADAYYNFATQRYEITVDILALTSGAEGNQPAGSIKNVQGNLGGMKVTNPEATTFGRDRESNTDLAVRSQSAYTSVDTGTEGGYQATSIATTGILKTKVVKSGDPLMMRDYDDVRGKHIGGKVDVWVQGVRERTVSEKFSFTFAVAQDTRCQVMSASSLTFRAILSDLTADNPIIEVLAVRNVSLGQDYNLTGMTLTDYRTIQLSTLVSQPATALDDVITADFRYRSVNEFAFTVQPVRRAVSVVGEVSGALDSQLGYQLYKTEDPLWYGESTRAQDRLVISQVNGVPAGNTIQVNAEEHVLVGFFEQPLGSVGINQLSLRVFSQDRLTEYQGPTGATPDFEIIAGTPTTPLKLARTTNSQIVSGQTISVDYQHDENFTVTYVVNDLLQQLQRTLDVKRHTTADVVAKQAILNSADSETTIQLKRGATKDKTDPAVRTNVSVDFNSRTIGQGIAQSDMIRDIDGTEGVDFQVLPLARMGYSDGARRIREEVPSSAQRISSLDSGDTKVYVFNSPVRYPTTDGGGLTTEHRGVFRDDVALGLTGSLSQVGQAVNQAYIVGASGAVVTGYSDDATLVADGFITQQAIAAERLVRTANRVFVSLSGSGVPLDVPEAHLWAVSYVVRGDKGPHDLEATQVEFLDLGALVLTFREAT